MGLGVGSEKTLRGGEVHAGFGRQRPKRACTHMCLCVHVCLTYPQSPITVLAAAQMANPSPSTICSLYLPHLGLVQTESGEVTMEPREQARRAFRQAGLSPCDFRGQDPGPLSTQLRGLGGKSLPNWSLGFRAGILTGLAESGSSTRGGSGGLQLTLTRSMHTALLWVVGSGPAPQSAWGETEAQEQSPHVRLHKVV